LQPDKKVAYEMDEWFQTQLRQVEQPSEVDLMN